MVWHFLGGVDDQLDVFLGDPGAEGFGHLVEQAAEVEGNGFNIEPLGLDLGEVEDVVDEGQEVARGGMCHGEVLVLTGVEVGLESQSGHVQDGVHRGADLVAHGRQKRAFGLVGGIGLGHGLLQFAGALHDGPFEFRLVLLKAVVGGAHLGEQLITGAGLEGLAFTAQIVCIGLEQRIRQTGDGPDAVVAPGFLERFEVVKEIAYPARQAESGPGLQVDHQGGPGIAVETNHQTAQGIRLVGQPDQGGDGGGQAGGVDGIEMEGARQPQHLGAALDVGRLRPQRDASDPVHAPYLRARQVASSCLRPKRSTTERETVAALSERSPG